MNTGNRHGQPQLGATFYPGQDDYYAAPEVISPLPQRSMPEVPAQIQQNLAQLEISATSETPTLEQQLENSMNTSNYGRDNGQHPQGRPQDYGPAAHTSSGPGHNRLQETPAIQTPYDVDQPSFSPFPYISNRPPNVPASDDEKEAILENARVTVLNSGDPERQLKWAHDVLIYVEVAMQNEVRLSETRPPRPSTPRTEHQLRVDAINVVSFLADQHHPKAEFMKGMWLEFGKFGFRVDKKEAYRCYSRAARAGYARAEYRMGMQFEGSNEIVKAIQHYSLGVDAGDAASNYRLGMMTLLGQQGREQNYSRGLEMIKLSADRADENSPQGAYVYGMLKARELSQITVPDQYLPMDIINARYYIEKAAYLGFAKAQTKMGAAYELCQLGCSFNPALSLHYNNLAARQGEPEAEMAISKWFLSGYEGVFRKSESLAFEYAQRAAQTGLGTAEFAMGYFYEIGIHVPVNLKEARSWYVKAAEHGNRDASARVEGISRSKTLSRKDHERIAVAKITSGRANQRANGSQAPVQFPRPPASSYSHIGKPESATSYHPNQSFTSAPPSAAYQTSPYGGMNRPSSAATIGGFNQYGTLPMASEPQRPYSSAGAPGYGRPGNGGPGYGGPGYGEPNDGGQGNIYPQGGNRHPGLPATPVPSRPYPVDNTDYMNNVQKPLPPVDIGFTAPPDFSGADRQKPSQRPEYPNNPAPGYPGYVRPPPGRNYNGPPERTSSRPTVSPSPAQSYGDGHVPSPLVPSNPSTGRPPRGASLAQRPPPGSILGPAPQSMNTPPPPSSSLGGHFSGPSAASNAEGRKLAKGPSTFEAMGVPQTKKEEDCVVM